MNRLGLTRQTTTNPGDYAPTLITTGTSPGTGNTATRIELAASASATDGAYDPARVNIIAGTGAGQSRRILEYDGTNRYAYICRDWKTIPDATSEYAITYDPGDGHVNEGVAQAGGASTITLNALASASNNAYVGQMVYIVAGTGQDQARTIIGYDGATKVATVSDAWIIQPDATSNYVLLPTDGWLQATPTADSAANILMRDVIGNKNDTIGGNSIVALLRGVSGSNYDTCQFTGIVRYVSKSGDDGNSGLSPADAYLTISTAIAASSAGDAIRVGAGTYNEAGLDLNQTALELWLEAGVILQDSSDGTVLTVSGFAAVVRASGNVRIDPTGGATGVLVSGNFAYIEKLRVNGNNAGALGFDITGDGAEVIKCRCSDPTTAAYKIQGDTCLLMGCCTGGLSGATIGYWVTNNADKYRIVDCGSQGHGTAPWQADDGCTNGVVWNFSSGGGDGKWSDTSTNDTVVSDFTYPETQYAYSAFTATGGVGGAGTNYNIFQIHGAVRIFNVFGHVTTATPATNSTVNLELYSTNGSVDITDSAGAPNLVSRVVGTVLAKESTSTDPLEIGEPSTTPAIVENTNFRDPRVPIILIEDDSADTYIQVVLSAALASGAVHWHVEWEPITDDGFVEPV